MELFIISIFNQKITDYVNLLSLSESESISESDSLIMVTGG